MPESVCDTCGSNHTTFIAFAGASNKSHGFYCDKCSKDVFSNYQKQGANGQIVIMKSGDKAVESFLESA